MATTALEFRHMETLVALAECGNLSKAAERLFLTQSALSHQLKALESHYGAAVVEKNIRPLRFTAIGQRLLTLARAVLPLVAEAARTSRGSRKATPDLCVWRCNATIASIG